MWLHLLIGRHLEKKWALQAEPVLKREGKIWLLTASIYYNNIPFLLYAKLLYPALNISKHTISIIETFSRPNIVTKGN